MVSGTWTPVLVSVVWEIFHRPLNELITEAILALFDVNNRSAVQNGQNWLRLYLLGTTENPCIGRVGEGNPPSGRLRPYRDADHGGDNVAGLAWTAKTQIAAHTDQHGGPQGEVVILTYSFAAFGLMDQLKGDLAYGRSFGLAIDSDCHFWNTGVSFELFTGPRSLPGGGPSAWLLAFGVGAAGLVRRGCLA